MKKKLPVWAALCIVCVCAAAIVLLANRLTGDRIRRQTAAEKNAAICGVVEGAEQFEAIEARESRYAVDAAYRVLDADGKALGYVGRTTVTGYGGPVEVTAGLDMGGAITGVEVGGTRFAETPGLGALTREPAFTGQFVGKAPTITLGEDGVDSVSGASTTSRAVVSGVNAIANYFYTGELGLAEEQTEVYTGQTVSATRQGFAGPVTVTAGLSGDGAIEYLAIDTPDETDGLGKLASEKEFTGQFIGKRGPFAYGEDGIEAVSGATYTSNAALEAINEIASGGGEASAEPVTATAKGYGGDVTVTARLNGDNTIAALSVDTPDETDGLGKLCSESAFTDQFIGKTSPFAYGEDGIEAVTGATFTSTAVLEALNSVVPAGDKAAIAQAASAAAEAEPDAPAEDAGTVEPVEDAAEAAEEAREEALEAASGDATKYLRPRPEVATIQTEVGNTDVQSVASGADKYLRPRPVIATIQTEVGDNAAESDAIGATKYLRPRPEIAAIQTEVENDEAHAAVGDASMYLRPRPAFSAVGAAAEATDAAPSDYMKYMRPRPSIALIETEPVETEAAPVASSGDATKYLRPRPALAIIETNTKETEAAGEEAPAAETGDATKYLRPRPAA